MLYRDNSRRAHEAVTASLISFTKLIFSELLRVLRVEKQGNFAAYLLVAISRVCIKILATLLSMLFPKVLRLYNNTIMFEYKIRISEIVYHFRGNFYFQFMIVSR